MNSAGICHQILGCEIYVDAFHGHFLRNHTKNSEATFLLSHYHGDHYQSLPRNNKYKGPALIHCSHVTARLLIEVHKVQQQFVVGHDYVRKSNIDRLGCILRPLDSSVST